MSIFNMAKSDDKLKTTTPLPTNTTPLHKKTKKQKNKGTGIGLFELIQMRRIESDK
jgi:hypothetical protein